MSRYIYLGEWRPLVGEHVQSFIIFLILALTSISNRTLRPNT